MSDWLSFEGQIEALAWGKATYTILPLPEDVVRSLPLRKSRRVEVELNDVPASLAVTTREGGGGHFLWIGKPLVASLGVQPGDRVDARLRSVSKDDLDVPEDLALALRQADATGTWDALTPGKRRGLVHRIASAKRSDTRSKRIAALVAELRP